MSAFQLRRIRTLMEPEPGNPLEVEGVLNPAAVRGKDGHLYLFPRLVAKGNFSRIGIAKVHFAANGDPERAERLGIALEPKEDYEFDADGRGGCEDPRVIYLDELGLYVMTYTALSPRGPRIALAVSEDLFKWEKLGLLTFAPYKGLNFTDIDNKDACAFPASISDPNGNTSLALLHRPLFPGSRPEETLHDDSDMPQDDSKASIWISYHHMGDKDMARLNDHRRLAAPEYDWEMLKIGSGAPPLKTHLGWILIYHGVRSTEGHPGSTRKMAYSAGVMVLDGDDPTKILYRSPHPILAPEVPDEMMGMVADVVFPAGTDRREDIGQPNRIDVYYGMADDKIGVASMELPESIPS